MKNVLTSLTKSVLILLILLRLTATALAADVGIHKKILGSGTKTVNNIERANERCYENS